MCLGTREALDCVCVMKWSFISSFSIANNTTLWFLASQLRVLFEICLYQKHGGVSAFPLLSYRPEENSEEGCACKLSNAPMTLTLELSYRISIASGIYIRRLDTRALPREWKGRKDRLILRQCIARANFNG